MISVDYTFNLPNEYCVDHEQTDGKTRTATYDGPDVLYLIIDNETGKEAFGPITELEKRDGRPCPEGCRYVEVDCIENPLIAQLRSPVIDEAEEDYTDAVRPPGVVEIEGYKVFEYQIPLQPKDVYDPLSIHVDDEDNITVEKRTVEWAIMGIDGRLPTWDDVRAKRATMLKASDSEITDDMPEDLRARWMDYRQKLRDWPGVMEAAGVPPQFAYHMGPIDPASELDPLTGELMIF